MKKILIASLIAITNMQTIAAEKLSIAATPIPHAEILEFIKPKMAEHGIELDIKVFTDYVLPNTQVEEGAIDANFFQHIPYLDEFNNSRGTKLVNIGGVHVEPFGVYSQKYKRLDEIPEGATVAIPNDATNGGRALLLLERSGVIKLKDGAGLASTVRDIVENHKNIKFQELEAPTLPRVLDQVDAALINANYALQAGLNPIEDAIVKEDSSSAYVNIIVTHESKQDDDNLKTLMQVITEQSVADFINDKYQGAVIPIFTAL